MNKLRPWFMVALLFGSACIADVVRAQERGECDASQVREAARIVYIVTSLKEDNSIVQIELPCTNEIVKVKRCAVVAIHVRNSQRYCYPPDGKPQYFDITDTLEYWEIQDRR